MTYRLGFFGILFFLVQSLSAQITSVTLSGVLMDSNREEFLPYANVILENGKDSTFISGTITNEEGLFTISGVQPGDYYLELSLVGYRTQRVSIFVGSQSAYLDIGTLTLEEDIRTLNEVIVTDQQDGVSNIMDKKTYTLEENFSQTGGSVLQSMQNLPGVTIQDGKLLLRGNDRVTVLIDGKQTALTGFGNQKGLDNIPASTVEKIEIINNPSSRYDANGNAGIINIIFKKEKNEGLNGKIGFTTGLGALWVRKENLPTIRPQYQATPKINPSVSLNYRKNKINAFIQADNLYTQTLNKNEFVTRTYDDGTIVYRQTKRNRNTNFFTSKAGIDWLMNDHNTLTFSGLFGSEKILDHGDEPFFEMDLSNRVRLWQFLEDELKTTVMATAAYERKFTQPGHVLNIGFNYTFHRENEQYFFDNILPTYTGKDAFKLISDEKVADLTVDYVKPLKYGQVETGMKFRRRIIPTNMQFFPGYNSPLDSNAGGKATYREIIPALYGNYVFENKKLEAELGLRLEYVDLNYDVNPNHNTYKSDGYNYTQPFPNARLALKIDEHNKLSVFYNRRVDRPNEVDIRIFPKYDDAELIKVGNPALKPQFTNSIELGYKTTWLSGYFYGAMYHRMVDGTITRISSTVPGSYLIYAIFQNVNKSYHSGLEVVFSQELGKILSLNWNFVTYHNQIDPFTVVNLYPVEHTHSSPRQEIISGNVKLNATLRMNHHFDIQISGTYLAPDIIPQGTIDARFSVDLGMKKSIQKGKGELFLNANDLFNTLIIRTDIQGDGFSYTTANYYETQVVRVGYSYKF